VANAELKTQPKRFLVVNRALLRKLGKNSSGGNKHIENS
jgi:hypothetical protein